MTSALTVSPSQLTASQILEGLQTVREVLAPDLNADELKLFAMVANRSGLDPFARQIHAVKRGGRVTFQTGIDGYRSGAERTGEYDGSDEPEFGPLVGVPPHPEWARVTVYRWRHDQRVGQSATAYWDEFHPGGNAPMWAKMPRNQLAKCAEALALRKAFPYVLADVYTDAEMDQADARDAADARAVEVRALPTARERLAAKRAHAEVAAETVDAEVVIEDIPEAATCGSVAADGLMAGAVCSEPGGHGGAHKSDTGSWPA